MSHETEFVRKWKHDGNATMIQAVQIIASLTAERDQWKSMLESERDEQGRAWGKDVAMTELRAQVDALRTALEEIATGVDHPLGNGEPAFYEAMEWAGNIAREALGGKS